MRKFLAIACFAFAILEGLAEVFCLLFRNDQPMPYHGSAFIYLCLAFILSGWDKK